MNNLSNRVILGLALVFAGGLQTRLLAQALYPPVLPAPETFVFPGIVQTEDGRIVLAQSQGEYDGQEEPEKAGKANRTSVSWNTTDTLVDIINDANETCDRRIERKYRIDCLRVYYGWVADTLPNSGDYLPIRKAMRAAEKKLSAIVSANVDRNAPVITPREGHKKSGKKLPPLRAVKPSAVKKATAQAEAVVKETELVILRSGEDPARRTAHFQSVAEAVDSNLVVLRSA